MSIGVADEAVRGTAGESVTFSFGDPAADVYGLARLGLAGGRGSVLAILFSGREPVAVRAAGDLPVPDGADWAALELPGLRAAIEEPLTRWTVAFDAEDGQGFELAFEAAGAPAEVDPPLGGLGGYEQLCRVSGTVGAAGRSVKVACMGQRGHAWGDPDWDHIELARTVCAWTDRDSAALLAVRPAGAQHHADEQVWGAIWDATGLVELDEPRLSTTYDAEGRTRRAGLELWPAAEESWARRAAGEVLCGSSLDLGALRLDCAFFRWHMEGRDGVGRYDVLRRTA